MTNDELCEIMDYGNFLLDSNNKYDMKIYELLKKQIPKKPLCTFDGYWFNCPTCGRALSVLPKKFTDHKYEYCRYCGQLINWGDDDGE